MRGLLGRNVIQFKVQKAGSFVRGRWQQSEYTGCDDGKEIVYGCIQPHMSGVYSSLQTPAGDENKERIEVYTTHPLHSSDVNTKARGDLIFYLDKVWEVRVVLPYLVGSGLDHYEAVAVRIDDKGLHPADKSQISYGSV